MTIIVTDYLRVQYLWDNAGTPTWTTITGDLHNLTIDRPLHKAAQVAFTMFNDLLDPSKHPSNDEHVRKGQSLRVQANIGGTWKSQFTGTINKVDVNPDPAKLRGGTLRSISVIANDSIHKRHQKPHSHGVGASDDLRAYIDLPFKINGLTTTKSTTGVDVWENDNTSEWDQILITRDTEQGFVWNDKDDVLNIRTRAGKSTTNKADITPDDYSNVDLNFTLDSLINYITVKLITKGKNQKTHVLAQGTYKDDASIAKYGTFKSQHIIQGTVWDLSTIPGYANDVLDRNSDPATVPSGCSIPITGTGKINSFVDNVDLADLVTIEDPDGTVYSVRVNSIKHEVTPNSRNNNLKWKVTFTFVHPDLVYKPTKKGMHDAHASTGWAAISDGGVETTHLDDGGVTTVKLADGAVTAAKTGFTVTDIGGHQFTTSTSAPSSPVTGDYWVDSTTGNVLKRYNGTTWVSIQDVAINTAQTAANTAQTAANAAQTAANTAQTTADGKNKVTYSTSSPGATANTAGDIWFRTSGTTVIEQWKGTGGTSWTQVTLDNAVIATLDAGKITSGYINTARLQVGGPGNFLGNPGFELGVTTPHATSGGATLSITSTANSGTNAGLMTLATQASTTVIFNANGTATVAGNHLPTANGDVIHAEAWVRKITTAGTVTSRIQIRTFNAAGTQLTTYTATGIALTTTYQKISLDATVADPTVAYAVLQVTGSGSTAGDTIAIDDVKLYKKQDATYIQDGVITTAHIAANTITAADIAASTITSNEIAANTITAADIVAGTITSNELAANSVIAAKIAAGAIDGMTITGPLIQTATGVGSTVQGMTISADTSGGVIKFYTGLTTGVAAETGPGWINPAIVTPLSTSFPILDIASPANGTASRSHIKLLAGEIDITDHTVIQAGGLDVTGGIIVLSGGVNVTGASDFQAGVTVHTADITITGVNNSINLSNPNTTTNATNARINNAGAGDIRIVTSLSKYKIHKEDITLEQASGLLDVTPKTWYDRNDWYGNNRKTDGLRRVPGVIAEDIEKYAPTFALYKDDELEGVAYERLAAGLIVIIKDQQARIEALEARVGG